MEYNLRLKISKSEELALGVENHYEWTEPEAWGFWNGKDGHIEYVRTESGHIWNKTKGGL